MADEVLAPYVEVRSEWLGTGAGTVITLDGMKLVLTAGHVVEGYADTGKEEYTDAEGTVHAGGKRPAREITLRKTSHTEDLGYPSRVVWYSPVEEKGGVDLALLTAPEALVSCKGVLTGKLEYGEDVWYIGTPAGVHARLERSLVAALDRKGLGRRWTVTNGCGYFGSSGGGAYVLRDGHYLMCGVLTRGMDGPKGAVFLQQPADILHFLDSYRKHLKEKPCPAKG